MEIKDLKSELSKKGYATNCLWHMDDVSETLNQYNDAYETNHRLTAWECSAIMEEVLDDERVKVLIIDLIDEYVTKRIE
jgi:hypothetical protein